MGTKTFIYQLNNIFVEYEYLLPCTINNARNMIMHHCDLLNNFRSYVVKHVYVYNKNAKVCVFLFNTVSN